MNDDSDLSEKYANAHEIAKIQKKKIIDEFNSRNNETEYAIYFIKQHIDMLKVKYSSHISSERNDKIVAEIAHYFPNADKEKIKSYLNGRGIYTTIAFSLRISLSYIFIILLVSYYKEDIKLLSEEMRSMIACWIVAWLFFAIALIVIYQSSSIIKPYFTNFNKLKSE